MFSNFNTSRELLLKLLIIFLFGLCFIYYFITPVTGDIFVFLGSSHLADIQHGGGLEGAILSWELKPFANRVFIYLIYKFAGLFVSFENKELFIIVTKAVNLFLLLITSWIFTKTLYNKFKFRAEIKRYVFFLVSTFLIFFTFRSVLQPEYTCLLISLISLYYLQSGKQINLIFGVILLSIMPFFKGITIIYTFQVLVLLWGFFNVSIKKLLKITLTFIGVMSFIVCMFLLFYPQEILDFKSAMLFQSTYKISPLIVIKAIIEGGFGVLLNFIFYPLMPFSMVALIVFIIDKKSFLNKSLISIIVLWIIGFGAIVVQRKFFVYHYVNLSLPVMFSILILGQVRLQKHKVLINLSIVGTVIFFFLFLLINSPLQKILNFNLPDIRGLRYINNWSYLSLENQININKQIIEIIKDFPKDKTVLYLDSGLGVWNFGMRSASRYYYPLPLQRVKNNHVLNTTSDYFILIDLLSSYDKEFIFLDYSWLDISGVEYKNFKNTLSKYKRVPIEGTKMDLYIRD